MNISDLSDNGHWMDYIWDDRHCQPGTDNWKHNDDALHFLKKLFWIFHSIREMTEWRIFNMPMLGIA